MFWWCTKPIGIVGEIVTSVLQIPSAWDTDLRSVAIISVRSSGFGRRTKAGEDPPSRRAVARDARIRKTGMCHFAINDGSSPRSPGNYEPGHNQSSPKVVRLSGKVKFQG